MFRRVFDFDNPLMQALAATYDLILVNTIAVLTALPVVTAGASLTALHRVSLHLARKEDISPARTFFESFRKNLKAGSLLGLIFLFAELLCGLEFLLSGQVIPVLQPLFAACAIFVWAVSFYAFGLLAQFENTIGNILQNAVRLTIGCFPKTLGMVLFSMLFYYVTLRYWQIGMPVLLLFGVSLPIYVSACFYNSVFRRLAEQSEKEDGQGESVSRPSDDI